MEARLDGLTLFYTDSGSPDRPTIVFLHGFPFDHTMWQGQVELLQATHRVITYDHRGHGRSGIGDGQYAFEFFVDDFFALLDHLKIRKAIVAGLSMGGYVALRAIEREPQRFSALILCDTRSEADSNAARINRSGTIKLIKKKGVPEFAEGFLKGVFAAGSFSKIPAAVERIRQTICATPARAICGTMLALAGRTDTTAVLPGIAVPTLVLVGEEDAITPPAAAESLRAKIPGAQLFTIPQSGHLSNIENPASFNSSLQNFLQSLPQ